LFKNFPHKNLVIPAFPAFVAANANFECTCTLIWLLQNHELYFKLSLMNQKLRKDFDFYLKNFTVDICTTKNNFSFLYDSCRFEEKLSKCNTFSIPKKIHYDLTALNLFFLLEWLKLVIEVYAKTFLVILGLITNMGTMLVVKIRNFQKNFHNIMYKHIFYNSMFNFIFCFINSFSLLNTSIFSKTSFCSSVYKTYAAQYFKIVFLLFVGNALRLCCNFSFLSFSVSRFYVSTAKKSKFFLRFEKLNAKLLYSIMFVSCSLWSMYKLFEYAPNEVFSSFDRNFPYNIYDLRYCQLSLTGTSYRFLASGCQIFPILNLINNIFNNIIFLCI
jgi:hypothetical protein